MSDTEIGLFEAMYTQRAIRSFKPDPIPRDVLERIVEAATKAPSGGNRQPWAFVMVQDRAAIAEMADHARAGFQLMFEAALKRAQPGDPKPFPRLAPMIEAFEIIPALAVVCAVGAPGAPVNGDALAGSIFPAVQNLLLAARGLGVGAALTAGWAQSRMTEIKALLHLPEHVSPLAFIPLGYPDKERYGSTTRRPLAEVLHWDTYEETLDSSTPTHR